MAGVLFVQIGVIISAVFLHFDMATEVIAERAEVYYFSKKYFSNVTLNVRRTSRKSPYYFNSKMTTLTVLGENVTMHGVFYEFLHNEYKRSFVQFDINLCKLKKEPWYTMVGKALAARGFGCPAQPDTYRLYNMVISMKNLPYVWPFEKAMLQGYAKFVPTEEIILRTRLYVTFKRELPKGK